MKTMARKGRVWLHRNTKRSISFLCAWKSIGKEIMKLPYDWSEKISKDPRLVKGVGLRVHQR